MHSAAIAVRARGVGYTYRDGTSALEGLDLDLYQGQRLALLGANGAGKSTLLLRLSGLLEGPGTVETPLPAEAGDRAMPTGIVFQDPDDQLLMPTVEDEVAFGLLNLGYGRDEARTRTSRILQATGLLGLEQKAPECLSFGQRKRLCVAAVLALEPHVLLLDEPDAGLDPAGKRDLAGLLSQLPCAVLAATHDLGWASEFCTDALVLHRGRVAVSSPVHDILADREALRAVGL